MDPMFYHNNYVKIAMTCHDYGIPMLTKLSNSKFNTLSTMLQMHDTCIVSIKLIIILIMQCFLSAV